MSKPLVIAGKRKDGRKPQEYRAPSCAVGVTENAQGSSYVESLSTKVTCSVYGPKQTVDDPAEACDVKVNFTVATFAEAAYKRRHAQQPTSEDRNKAASLEEAFGYAVLCEKYPKSRIELNFLVLQRGVDDYAASVLAASLALMDAGIEMHDIVTAATASFTANGETLLDPTSRETRRAVATLTTTCLPNLGSILSVNQSGTSTSETTEEGIKLCCKTCTALRDVVATTLREAAEKNG